jgi:hypothetical protein
MHNPEPVRPKYNTPSHLANNQSGRITPLPNDSGSLIINYQSPPLKLANFLEKESFEGLVG